MSRSIRLPQPTSGASETGGFCDFVSAARGRRHAQPFTEHLSLLSRR